MRLFKKITENKEVLAMQNMHLQDVDFTIDYSGCMDKAKIIQRIYTLGLEEYCVIQNDHLVGANCLSYMYNSVRCKMYNKFCQSMETGAVADSVGNHISSWVDHKDTRMREMRE